MNRTPQEIISHAQSLVEQGDYRQARKTIRNIKTDQGLSPDDLNKKNRILAVTGIDPYIATIVALTFVVWAILFFKYVL
jgi:hypothetical protein